MFQLVELIVPATITAGGQQVMFQNQPQLQSVINDAKVYIKAIEIVEATVLAKSPLTIGNANAGYADIQNATLTLSVNGVLQYQYLPLGRINPSQVSDGNTASQYQPFLLKNVYKVDWTKSYITTVAAPTLSPPFSYLFGVHYSYCADPGDAAEEQTQR